MRPFLYERADSPERAVKAGGQFIAGGTTIGRKGMVLAAKVLSATAWDLYTKPELLAAAKAEHQRRLAATPYVSLLEPSQKPPLDYRNPPQQAIKAGVAE